MDRKTTILKKVNEFKELVANVSARFAELNGNKPSNDDIALIAGVSVEIYCGFLKPTSAAYMTEKMKKATKNLELYVKECTKSKRKTRNKKAEAAPVTVEEPVMIIDEELDDAEIDATAPVADFSAELQGTESPADTEPVQEQPEQTEQPAKEQAEQESEAQQAPDNTEPASDVNPASEECMTAEDKYMRAIDEMSAQCDNTSDVATAIRDGFIYIFYPRSEKNKTYCRKKFSPLNMAVPLETIEYKDDKRNFRFTFNLIFSGMENIEACSYEEARQKFEKRLENMNANFQGITAKIPTLSFSKVELTGCL